MLAIWPNDFCPHSIPPTKSESYSFSEHIGNPDLLCSFHHTFLSAAAALRLDQLIADSGIPHEGKMSLFGFDVYLLHEVSVIPDCREQSKPDISWQP
jgi:hypothetical protein